MGMTYLYPPVTVSTLPPIGGATAANQLAEIAELQALNAKDFATETTLSTLNGKVPANLTVTATRLLVDGSGVTQPVSAASLPLPTGAATETTLTNVYNELVTSGNEANTNALTLIDDVGAKNETAPATDTASSGLNGRLQRIAQRLTSLIALFPSSIGQKAKTDSLSVTLASDQGALAVTPTNNSGTVYSDQIGVGNSTPVRATVSGGSPNAARKKLIIKPSKTNNASIFIGGPGATILNSVEIIGPDRVEFNNDASDYYLISDDVAQLVEILEVY